MNAIIRPFDHHLIVTGQINHHYRLYFILYLANELFNYAVRDVAIRQTEIFDIDAVGQYPAKLIVSYRRFEKPYVFHLISNKNL